MYHKHNTRGIVVSGRAEGPDSRRISLLTESFGLVSARVQGGRSSRSKQRSSCQDFSMGEFSLVWGKGGWKVAGARAEINFFEKLRSEPGRLQIAGNVLNLVKKLSAEEEKSPLFGIVSNFFRFLAEANERDIAVSECLTLARILHCLGYMKHDPELAIPLSSFEIGDEHLQKIAPRRFQMIALINESLKIV